MSRAHESGGRRTDGTNSELPVFVFAFQVSVIALHALLASAKISLGELSSVDMMASNSHLM